MYIGSISGVIGAFLYEQSVDTINPCFSIADTAFKLPFGCTSYRSCLLLFNGYIKSKSECNRSCNYNFRCRFRKFFGGSLIKLIGSAVPSVALTATSAVFKKTLPLQIVWVRLAKVFLSYGF